MPPAGVEVVARWREAGAWWAGERPLEVVQWRDRRGVRREKTRRLPEAAPPPVKPEWHEDLSVEITLRPRKTRDEKVAKACSTVKEAPPPSYTHRAASYAPLHVMSGYSYGRSVLLAREVPRRAAEAGIPAVALVDRFSLTGAVEFARDCRECGVKPLIGTSLEMEEGGELTLVAKDRTGYQSLSELLTECHLSEPRLSPLCTVERLAKHSRGLMCLTGGDLGRLDRLVLQGAYDEAEEWADLLVGLYGKSSVFVEVERSWLPWGMTLERRLTDLAHAKGLTAVAGGAVCHARPEDFPSQDVALCAETLCTVEEVVGRKPLRDLTQLQVTERPLRSLNAERYLRTPEEARQLYKDRPEFLANTLLVADRCDDDVLPSRTRLPSLFDDPGRVLTEATYAGAGLVHKTVSKELKRRLDAELERIVRLNFADHFLTIWDACRWAADQGIHFSGRGSMVDSAVSYCLGLSRIDAHRHNLHFDRFLPEDGSKRPDIDIDFEAKRRDDVRNYLVQRHGRDRVATVAAVGAYNTRGIVREVGKVLGLSNEAIGFLAKRIHGGVVPEQLENALDKRPELRDSGIDRERLHWLFRLAKSLADVPRNIRSHSSGVVISDRPLAETVPVMWSAAESETSEFDPETLESSTTSENVRIIQWDKRSAKHYFDKFDILCLRGQDVLSGTERRVRASDLDFNVQRVPVEDDENYRAMRAGELIGVPQSASPAMRQAHMRIQTQDLHDASLVQAGIRPGVGGAVKINELIARRRGLKPYSFDHPDLEKVLGITYGIVVFQEQIDQLLQVFAGYGSGEAEDIRDEIHKRRREDYGEVIKEEVIARVVANGYSRDIADKVFEYVAGFKGYGFAQGHALAFAEISLRSIHCQQNFPAEYFASLLDAQPAGYYGPCTLVNEARIRGVAVLPVDVNQSVEEHKVEDVRSPLEPHIVLPNAGIRLALTCVSGVSKAVREKTVASRERRYTSFHDYVRRVRPDRDELERMIVCGAFDSLEPNRRALLWAVPQALAWAQEAEEGLFSKGVMVEPAIDRSIPDFTWAEKAIRERSVLGLDVTQHIMHFERERVGERGGMTCAQAKTLKPGQKAIVVGNPIRLRFPPTPSGRRVVFFDLEDETGLLNVTCFDATYQRDGHAIVTSPYVTLIGVGQWRDGHTAFLAKRAFPYDPVVTRLVDLTEPIPVRTADFLVG